MLDNKILRALLVIFLLRYHLLDLYKFNFADRGTESIPSLLQDVIERLVGMQIMTVKPDSCIIDFYNEVDH